MVCVIRSIGSEEGVETTVAPLVAPTVQPPYGPQRYAPSGNSELPSSGTRVPGRPVTGLVVGSVMTASTSGDCRVIVAATQGSAGVPGF